MWIVAGAMCAQLHKSVLGIHWVQSKWEVGTSQSLIKHPKHVTEQGSRQIDALDVAEH